MNHKLIIKTYQNDPLWPVRHLVLSGIKPEPLTGHFMTRRKSGTGILKTSRVRPVIIVEVPVRNHYHRECPFVEIRRSITIERDAQS